MSRNSSGTYTLPSGNPVVSGTLIEASWANTTLSDLASAMTDSLSRSGQGGMTAALRLFDGTSSVPGLAWGSETTTGFYRAGAGDTRLVVTGSEVQKWLSTGVAITGTLSASGNFAINTDKFTVAASTGNTAVAGTLAVTGATTFSGQTNTFSNATAYYPQIINRNTTSDANASYFVLDKIRGSSVVQNGDVLGNLVFRGYDGTQYLQGAYINAVVSAAPGTNDMPTDLVFGTTPDAGAGPSERMRLDQRGNLGLGVTPSAWSLSGYAALQVGNGAFWASTTSDTLITSNSYYNGGWKYSTTRAASQYEQFAGAHYWYTAPSGTAGNAISFTQAMTLDASGNLGIGITSPSQKVSIGFLAGTVGYNIVYTGGGGGEVAAFTANGSTGEVRIGGTGSTYFPTFYSNGSERARIDSSGNLLVGTTSNAYSNTDSVLVAPTTGGGQVVVQHKSGSSSGASYCDFIYNAGRIGNISQNGTTAVAYNTTSDYRLKEDIQPMTGALAKVAALKPVTYKWKADGSDGEGFIAHELAEVVPQCVTGEKDAVDAEGKPVYQGIDTSFLVATLTAALQEAVAEINSLKADVAVLKGA